MNTPRRAQRGMSLIEALVAFAVAAVGLIALTGAQTHLRLGGDLVRQRAEALRLAEGELERLRAFTTPAALAGFATLPTEETAALPSNTRFTLRRQLLPQGSAPMLAARVSVSWPDRQGQPVELRLDSLIAGIDPALSGRLSAPPARPAQAQPLGRAGIIPIAAVDLGDGRSAFVPPGSSGIAWVFDNTSGEVGSLCSVPAGTAAAAVNAEALNSCIFTHAWLLAGHVRFATGDAVTLQDAEHPASPALELDMRLTLQYGSAPSPACFDDAGTRNGQTDVAFHCLVTPDDTRRAWSGRLDVAPRGWALGDDAQSYRVCRYSADHDGRNGITNDEHPLDHVDVRGPLKHQNFLVVRGSNRCPAGDGTLDANTVEQAPHPAQTPRA